MYLFEFHPYRKKFLRPLKTSHGIWDVREGIIISLRNENGENFWGEIAPIDWFGLETLQQALDFCVQLPNKITKDTIFSIPDELPACQFGFESAMLMGNGNKESETDSLSYSALLSSGKAALEEWQTLYDEGYQTFKWKIGVWSMEEELKILTLLTQALPTGTKLRLDANGGLDFLKAIAILDFCEKINDNPELPNIEFVEQPLAMEKFPQMLELTQNYQTPIALDESVADIKQLSRIYEKGWPGIFVIKPLIAGFPSRIKQFCQENQIDTVFSSVFETSVGRQAALQLARELNFNNRAVGFGVSNFGLNIDATG
jgi:o-succinylbenzoate synthase